MIVGTLICGTSPQHDWLQCPAATVVGMLMCGLDLPEQELLWRGTAGASQCCPPGEEGQDPFWRGLLGQVCWTGLVLRRMLGQSAWC